MTDAKRPAPRRILWLIKSGDVFQGTAYGWNLSVQGGTRCNEARSNWSATAQHEPEIVIGEFRDKYKALEGAEEWAKANRRDA
ncbi:MAG: hypothetical protein P4L67_04340 [Candidatus Pacebacteria bacterium]|nr:hypothetical protein [Candidatus Paceibacterota bacterium]